MICLWSSQSRLNKLLKRWKGGWILNNRTFSRKLTINNKPGLERVNKSSRLSNWQDSLKILLIPIINLIPIRPWLLVLLCFWKLVDYWYFCFTHLITSACKPILSQHAPEFAELELHVFCHTTSILHCIVEYMLLLCCYIFVFWIYIPRIMHLCDIPCVWRYCGVACMLI